MSAPGVPNPKAKPKARPNPFYVLLLLASTGFVVTALMYYVSPIVLQRAEAPRPGARALIGWLDRRGPLVLGVEFVVMFGAGVLAMLTDDWFAPKPPTRPTDSGPR